MRDTELLISLLQEMANNDSGQMIVPNYMGMDDDELQQRHHCLLLVDALHADWDGKDFIRITNKGYDLLNAMNNQPKMKDRLLKLMNNGSSFVDASLKVIEFVNRTIGS